MNENPFEQTQTVFRDVLRDPRRHPRIPLRRPGQVLLADGARVQVDVHDLSPDGAQLRCARRKAQLVHPSGRSIKDGEVGPTLELVCALPLSGAQVPVKITGSMIYFALINPDVVAIGLKFADLSATSRDHLVRYVGNALQPRDYA